MHTELRYEWHHLWNENIDMEQNIQIDGASFQFCHLLCKLGLLYYFLHFFYYPFK